jgi:hypothetical protein
MILVAAAAVGLLIYRHSHVRQGSAGTAVPFPMSVTVGMELVPFVIVWPPALLVARVLRPRPRLRRLVRQPGTVACLAALFVLSMAEFSYHVRNLVSPSQFPVVFRLLPAVYMGESVALAWGVLALVGAWRPEASWVDRAGRVFGWFLIILWILMSLTSN